MGGMGNTIEIPAALTEMRGEGAAEWLAALPTIIQACVERWELRLEGPFPRISFNYAAPVERRNREPAVLKVCPPDSEFVSEMDALATFAGRGMVRLLAADKKLGALLLERIEPGRAIIDLPNDATATGTALEVMQRFWTPPEQPHRFLTLQDWFDRAFARHRALYGGHGPFDAALFARSEALIRELLATSEEPVLLHGDLNYGNVLSAERAPWLGIDPKGVVGERIFDTAILLHDPMDRILSQPSPEKFLRRRVDQIVEQTGFPRERVIGWGIAYAVLSSLWWAEDGGTGWDGGLECAEVLERL